MKKSCFCLLMTLLITFGVPAVQAATNYVLVGQNLQAAIDASLSGDTLVIQAGVYPDSPNFNKPLTVLRSGSNQVQIVGPVQITGSGNHYYSQCQFSSTVTIQATGTVSFVQSQFLAPLTSTNASILMSGVTNSSTTLVNLASGTFTNLQAFNSTLGPLTVTAGKSLVKRTTLTGGLTLSGNSSLEALRVTNFAAITATTTVGSGASFVMVQSELTLLSLTGYRVWLGYNNSGASGLDYGRVELLQCDSVLIGNKLYWSPAINCSGGILRAFNNRLYASGGAGSSGVMLNGTSGELINNTIVGGGQSGIQASGAGEVKIRANILQTTWAIWVPSGGPTLDISYCCYNQSLWGNVPTASANMLNADALLVGGGLAYTLQPVSPCINAGPPEAIYNDRDGSRNDMGYTGGPYWNPANYTNDNPMVFFLTGSPQIVFKGAQTNLQVNVGASAGH